MTTQEKVELCTKVRKFREAFSDLSNLIRNSKDEVIMFIL